MYDIAGVLERGFGPQDERAALQLARTMFPGAEAGLASLLDDLRHGCWPRVVIRRGCDGPAPSAGHAGTSSLVHVPAWRCHRSRHAQSASPGVEVRPSQDADPDSAAGHRAKPPGLDEHHTRVSSVRHGEEPPVERRRDSTRLR